MKQHSKLFWFFHDSGILIGRSLKHITKNLDQLLGVAVQPIMFMLLFRYVFGGAIDPGNTTYVNFLVAGIIVQNAAFGAMTTSIEVAIDMTRGIMDRFKSLPMSNASVLIGHIVADLFRNMISGSILVAVALLIGFRPEASFTDWLAIGGILLLFTFAMSWLSSIMGLLAKSMEAVQWMGFFIIFPLTFASSAFAPTEGMPGPLRWFAENQPVTQVIEAIRALMVGLHVENHLWLAVIWCVAAIAVAIPLASTIFRRKNPR